PCPSCSATRRARSCPAGPTSSPRKRRRHSGTPASFSSTRCLPSRKRRRDPLMPLLKIANGTVYDPANGIDGKVQDLWIQDGKVVAPPDDPGVRPDKTLDATGLVVMPGGVDMHAHIAGPKVNL